MKLLFCLISVLVVASYVSGQNYVNLSRKDLQANFPLIRDLLEYGAARVFKIVAANHNVQSLSNRIRLDKLYSISRRTLNSRAFYRFDVEMDNYDGATVTATFTVEYVFKTKAKSLESYHSHINVEYGISGNCVTISPANYHSAILENLLIQGADQIVMKNPNKIPNANYHLAQINSASRCPGYNGNTYYKFNIEAENANGDTKITMNFVMRDGPKANDAELQPWGFTIQVHH